MAFCPTLLKCVREREGNDGASKEEKAVPEREGTRTSTRARTPEGSYESSLLEMRSIGSYLLLFF
jgi:hypothetical protein